MTISIETSKQLEIQKAKPIIEKLQDLEEDVLIGVIRTPDPPIANVNKYDLYRVIKNCMDADNPGIKCRKYNINTIDGEEIYFTISDFETYLEILF